MKIFLYVCKKTESSLGERTSVDRRQTFFFSLQLTFEVMHLRTDRNTVEDKNNVVTLILPYILFLFCFQILLLVRKPKKVEKHCSV